MCGLINDYIDEEESLCTKPVLGVKPKHIWLEERIQDVYEHLGRLATYPEIRLCASHRVAILEELLNLEQQYKEELIRVKLTREN